MLKCVIKALVEDIIEELHRETCGDHSGECNMTTRVLRAEYY